MKNILLFACVLFVLSPFVSCTHKLKELTLVPQIKEYTILIAGDSSDFKDNVRNKLIETYRSYCEIQVVNIKDLSKIDSKSYDVVVIMDTCMAWGMFNPSMKSFLDNDDNRVKTVLAMTAGNPNWKYCYNGVDAITSASRINKEEDFFKRIDMGIQRRIHSE